jgi:hypothetical protein
LVWQAASNIAVSTDERKNQLPKQGSGAMRGNIRKPLPQAIVFFSRDWRSRRPELDVRISSPAVAGSQDPPIPV